MTLARVWTCGVQCLVLQKTVCTMYKRVGVKKCDPAYFKELHQNCENSFYEYQHIITLKICSVNQHLLCSRDRSSNRAMRQNSSFQFGHPKKLFVDGQMTSSPCSCMSFLSTVMQYCGLSSVHEAYRGLQRIICLLTV